MDPEGDRLGKQGGDDYSPPPPDYIAGQPPPGPPLHHQPRVAFQDASAGNVVHIQSAPHVMFSAEPVSVMCSHCNQQVTTITEHENGAMTWCCALGICLCGGWLGCCLIPMCVDGCKDVVHFCPNCKNVINRYKRM